jgi:hypothetical protein
MTLYMIGSFFPALAARDRVKRDHHMDSPEAIRVKGKLNQGSLSLRGNDFCIALVTLYLYIISTLTHFQINTFRVFGSS